jgi:hypothetical protein
MRSGHNKNGKNFKHIIQGITATVLIDAQKS